MKNLEEVMPKMQKVLDNLTNEFSTIRSGRAHPSILENIKVLTYGQSMALSAIATITAMDVKTLVVTTWDHANVEAADKALRQSPLGLNPRIEGNKLFVTFPPITEERRLDLIKLVKQKEEEAKVAIRNIRRDINGHFKEISKTQEISKDEEENLLKEVQKITDSMIKNASLVSEKKQQELRHF